MLQLRDITKSYITAGFAQTALDGLSVTFRENEFAAILGPSGSGKTTLLNIIGGLDKADSGELLIDGVSTKLYRDRDWDAYRNNRIGFVFQSYNLITHQTVLSNVELALTLSGVSKSERQARARQALAEVGLSEHVNKRPSQLSGGQMQRVAIARALVNNPEILLADEPTGALDSKTSLQIMELLERIAKDRLVVMVTHNPTLADTYANRIINLSDGRVVSDSNPYTPTINQAAPTRTIRRTSMSFLTSLSLSFSNLMTKKGRTIMTAFAGSIGIIGIAAILALANGVNAYIKGVEESTLSQYPLAITSTGMDLSSMLVGSGYAGEDDEEATRSGGLHISTGGEGYVREINLLASMFESVTNNDLKSLKEFFDDEKNEVWNHVNAIEYSYDVTPQIFLGDTSGGVYQVNPDIMTRLMDPAASGMSSGSSAFSMGMNMSIFNSLPRNMSLIDGQYDVLAGRWPEKYNECVLVVVRRGLISDYVMYTLGLRDPAELRRMLDEFSNQKEVTIPNDERFFSYEDIMGVDLRLVLADDFYTYDSAYDIYVDHRKDDPYLTNLIAESEHLYIVGIVGSTEGSTLAALRPGINYSPLLIDYLIEQADKSPLVKAQLDKPDIDVFTGKTFEVANREAAADFDMSKMLSIDEDAMAGAFQFDTSAFSGMNFGNLDLSSSLSSADLAQSMPDFPPLDLGAMLSGLEISDLPLEGLSRFAMAVLTDYLTDRADVIEDEAGDLLTGFAGYLLSDEGQYILSQSLPYTIDQAKLGALVMDIIADFLSQNQGITDPEILVQAFVHYLDTHADAILQRIIDDDIVRGDVLMHMVTSLIDGYLQYSGLTLEDIGTSVADDFTSWLAEPGVSSRVAEHFNANVNLNPLISKLSAGLASYMQQTMQTFMYQLMSVLSTQLAKAMSGVFGQISSAMSGAFSFDAKMFQSAFVFNMTEDELGQLMLSMMGRQKKSYESNLKLLGYADAEVPSSIAIYPKDFDSKQSVIDILDSYNKRMEQSGQDDKVIVYTDLVGALMSSVTDVINKISMVLVAFVAISLIVSSIMIGIVTYISVLERKKEIGILRSIGASKQDIGNVFNAETLIIGLAAGVIGISLTWLGCFPANMIVDYLIDVERIAQLPLTPSLVLIGISCLLSFVAGLIPSAAASRRDPVEALRSE